MATKKGQGHFEKLTVFVEPDVAASLEKLAAEERRPLSSLARNVLSDFVDEHRERAAA
jgi:predicted transcriptional regulator